MFLIFILYHIFSHYIILFYFIIFYVVIYIICCPPNKHRPSKPPIHFMSLAKGPIYACCQAKRFQRPQPGQRRHTNFVFRTTSLKFHVKISEIRYDARNSLNWSESLLRSVTWCVACDLPKDVEKLCLLHAPLHKLEKTCGALHPWKFLHLTLTSPVLNQLCSKAIWNTRHKATILTNWLRQLLPPIGSAQNGNHKHPSQQSGFVDSGALLIHRSEPCLFLQFEHWPLFFGHLEIPETELHMSSRFPWLRVPFPNYPLDQPPASRWNREGSHKETLTLDCRWVHGVQSRQHQHRKKWKSALEPAVTSDHLSRFRLEPLEFQLRKWLAVAWSWTYLGKSRKMSAMATALYSKAVECWIPVGCKSWEPWESWTSLRRALLTFRCIQWEDAPVDAAVKGLKPFSCCEWHHDVIWHPSARSAQFHQVCLLLTWSVRQLALQPVTLGEWLWSVTNVAFAGEPTSCLSHMQ